MMALHLGLTSLYVTSYERHSRAVAICIFSLGLHKFHYSLHSLQPISVLAPSYSKHKAKRKMSAPPTVRKQFSIYYHSYVSLMLLLFYFLLLFSLIIVFHLNICFFPLCFSLSYISLLVSLCAHSMLFVICTLAQPSKTLTSYFPFLIVIAEFVTELIFFYLKLIIYHKLCCVN